MNFSVVFQIFLAEIGMSESAEARLKFPLTLRFDDSVSVTCEPDERLDDMLFYAPVWDEKQERLPLNNSQLCLKLLSLGLFGHGSNGLALGYDLEFDVLYLWQRIPRDCLTETSQLRTCFERFTSAVPFFRQKICQLSDFSQDKLQAAWPTDDGGLSNFAQIATFRV